MNLKEYKSAIHIKGYLYLEDFFAEGWILIGREEKKIDDLVVTYYELVHEEKDKKLPAAYSKVLKVLASLR